MTIKMSYEYMIYILFEQRIMKQSNSIGWNTFYETRYDYGKQVLIHYLFRAILILIV